MKGTDLLMEDLSALDVTVIPKPVNGSQELRQTYTYTVMGTDTDYQDRLQMNALFSMLQEAASCNATEHGWGFEKLDGEDYCWILLRMSVRMQRLPSWREKVHVDTWSRGADKLYFHRDFIIMDENKNRIGAATSIWILADRISHRPVRPDHVFSLEKTQFDPVGVLPFEPPKLRTTYSAEEMASGEYASQTLVKYADFSEIDRNLHVNNTRYVAWSIDAAHRQSLEQGDIFGIDICYHAEIKFGEKVHLFIREDDPRVSIDGFCESTKKTAFSCCLFRAVDPDSIATISEG